MSGTSRRSPSARTTMRDASTLSTHAIALGHHADAGVDGRAALHAGADERRVRTNERHGLALHVRAHEGAVGVVVLEERNERGGDRHHLVRRDVHELRPCSGVTSLKSPFNRAETRLSLNLPFSSRLAVAWAMYLPSSSSAEYQLTSSVTLPCSTLRYGVSTKPYSLTRA